VYSPAIFISECLIALGGVVLYFGIKTVGFWSVHTCISFFTQALSSEPSYVSIYFHNI
jgi:hypothetical protein